jgi:hypothetical protein
MVGAHDAFILGYTPPLIGIYFNGVELLTAADKGANPELARRIEERIQAFESRQASVMGNVRLVQTLLAKHGLKVESPPRVPEEFHSWCKQIFAQVHTALSGPEQIEGAALHLFGFIFGDASLTLNLGAFVHLFLDASPEHAFLLEQAQALSLSQEKVEKQLTQALSLPALAKSTQEAAQPAPAILAAAPRIGGGGEHAARVNQLLESLNQLGEVITAVEKTLT